MSLKSLGRAIEKRILRPGFHRIGRLFGRRRSAQRIADLEERIARLEALFREQAGLQYLRLMDDSGPEADPVEGGATRRESA